MLLHKMRVVILLKFLVGSTVQKNTQFVVSLQTSHQSCVCIYCTLIMTVSVLLEQLHNKSDIPIKIATNC